MKANCPRNHFDAAYPITDEAAAALYDQTLGFRYIDDLDAAKVMDAGLDYAKLIRCLKSGTDNSTDTGTRSRRGKSKARTLSTVFGARCTNKHCLNDCNRKCPCATGTGDTCGHEPLACNYVRHQLALKSVTPNDPLASVASAILRGAGDVNNATAIAEPSPFSFAVTATPKPPSPVPTTAPVTALEARDILAASITDSQKATLQSMSADDFRANVGSVLGLL